VCTKDNAVGAVAAAGGGPAVLPVECIPREFTPGEISGTAPDAATGASLTPGQVILDERIEFLQKQGVPVPTCTDEFSSKGGVCPAGTPKAGAAPNSAGAAALQGVYGLLSAEKEVAAIAKNEFLSTHEGRSEKKVVRRSHGRTFRDLAGMTRAEVDTVLGSTKQIAFTLNDDIIHFNVETVSEEGGFTLAGQGKKVVVTEKSISYTSGGAAIEVPPQTTVISMARKTGVEGRRGGGFLSSGSFTLGSGSNRAGND
jgi:hypothetical protein